MISYIVAALVGALLAYFGGDYLGLYDGYSQGVHFIGAAVGALVLLALALALRPRRGVTYNGPTFD
ncbi:hypothetical protein BWI17_05465 [Betaproteobacteria bacterium GR16-43]|nr:hypothetical protein BWI17_05465 [Betaproteobacteria bacterium GR16-43]